MAPTRILPLIPIALFITACGGGSSGSNPNSEIGKMPATPEAENWLLVWSDEFDSDGLPDPTKWDYDVGGHGWGNQEEQYYTDSETKNARVENGQLMITAIKETQAGNAYTSARLVSRNQGDWLYGRLEIRAKLPTGRGTWPAIWMLPTDWVYGDWPASGEIDIMEHVGYDQDKVHNSIHSSDFNHTKGTQITTSFMVDDASNEFHDYAVEWRENRLDFYLDGVHTFTTANSQSHPENGSSAWPFDARFHLLLNIAVGGTWGGNNGIDSNIWPQTMIVDYVRVYQAN
ncbi:glycoside hydrolase family 16 protein [Agarivorans sp. MS3-6]